MNCTHVLGLIDAGPFADYPRAHLESAWAHARQCPACGPALEAATALAANLAALPRPQTHVTANVMARIARIESVQLAAARVVPTATAREWTAWATAFGGLGTVLAIALSAPDAAGSPIEIARSWMRDLTSGLLGMPPSAAGALGIATGLLLYVAGLFAPLRGRSRT